MHLLRQFKALLQMNLLGLSQKIGPVVTMLIGVACAVGVLISMLAMGVGARRQAMADVRADRVIVMSTGAQYPMQSNISKDAAYAIRDLPGIRIGVNEQPVVLFQAFVPFEGRSRTTGKRISFPLIGVSTGLAELAPEVQLTSGRTFRPGLYELIASNVCVRMFSGFDLGEHRLIRGREWTVVGHFDHGRSQSQCIVYADANSLLSAFNRENYNQITLILESLSAYETLLGAVKENPTLHVSVQHEEEVVEHNFKQLNIILNFASYFVGAIMAVGATLGAVNSLYAIVDTQRREFATLRAIGFGSGAIVASTLCESILIAFVGALLGGCLAWVIFNGFSASPLGFTFQLAVTPSLLGLGVSWALLMGLLGGLLPAVRAASVPVATALRAS